MRKYDFSPLWYKKQSRIKSHAKFRIVTLVLVALTVGSLVNFIINIKTDENMQYELSLYTQEQKKNPDKVHKDNESMGTLKELSKYITAYPNLSFTYVEIENKKTTVKANSKEIKQLEEFISKIEEEDKFKILDLNYTKGDNSTLEMVLES